MVWSPQIRWRAIILHYVYGIDAEHVALILGVSRRSVWNWQKKFERDGTVEDAPSRLRRSRWPEEVLEYVKFFVENDPTFLIEELKEAIETRFPNLINTSLTTICRALRHDLNLSRKVICKRAAEASSSEVRSYIYRLQPFFACPEQLVFVDETSKNSKDYLRKFGWSERGTKCHSTVPFSRGKRLSVLAAMDSNGFFAYECTEGTFDRKAFHDALVNKILPFMNPYPFPRSILILDNARIHAYPEIFQTVEAFGALLIFLPPYCPQLNPIEIGFGLLKRWISKHANYAWNVDPKLVLDIALKNCTCECKSTFIHCGYADGVLDFSHVLGDEFEMDDY
jgi:transposase